MEERRRGLKLLVVGLVLFFLLWGASCSRPCSHCQGTGKVTVLEACPQCVGTGSVRQRCPDCGGRPSETLEKKCGYCDGKGKIRCTYQETFPYVPYGVCDLPGAATGYAPREKVSCVNGRLQGLNRAIDDAFGRTGRSRLCPRCFGTGEVVCSICGGSGEVKGAGVCATCGGAGEVLKTCPRCNGLKTVAVIRPCPTCQGKGRTGFFH